jgi:hypothetical protein
MQPGRANPVDIERLQGHGAEDRMQIGVIQGVERLPQTAIMQGLRRQAGLQQRQHTSLIQTTPDFLEGVMAVEDRQHQGFNGPPGRHDLIGMGRNDGIDKRRNLKLSQDAQHQG